MAITVDKTTNVIKITGTTNASQAVDTNEVNIQSIKWFGDDIADGDIIILQNTNGDTVFKHIATAADTGGFWSFPLGHTAKGLKSDDIDSGEVHIYIK